MPRTSFVNGELHFATSVNIAPAAAALRLRASPFSAPADRLGETMLFGSVFFTFSVFSLAVTGAL